MENVNRWYFTKEELADTPSRRSGIDAAKELSYRQQASNFIQDMGQRLQVSQLCINTAIVYMHKFYAFHSFADVHRNSLSVAALFLAAKVEEQPRKLEHVIKVAHLCLHKDCPPLDVRTEAYADKQFEVVAHENVLLQTLGFVLAIEHPHTYVVKVCQLVKASKDLAQTSYFMATTSLHMTTMCLQYKPTVVACVCIHLACKWSSWKIEPCSEGKEWYYYVDKSVTLDLLENLTQEFIAILETSPHRFKRKFIAQKEAAGCHGGPRTAESDFRQHHTPENKTSSVKKEIFSPGASTSSASFNLSQIEEKPAPIKIETVEKPPVLLPPPIPQPILPIQSPPRKNKIVSHSISIDVYREKKEKERLELKTVPAPIEHVQPPAINKLQPVLSEIDRIHKNPASSVEQHSHPLKEKPNKSSVNKEHQVHSTSLNKMNHHLPKVKSDGAHSKESKSNLMKMPSGVSNDPIVVLERVDAKSEVHQDITEPKVLCPAPQPIREKVANIPDHKYPTQVENTCDSRESLPTALTVTSSHVAVTKSKHPKHKTNSVHNSHNSAQSLPHKLSPIKDLKTNGSKETDPNERRNTIVENNIVSAKTESTKHEKREKHKSKHSSRDKSISNHSEHSNPAIKVKIRKDIINLPDKSQKPPPPVIPESPKKSLKIKLPKPPAAESVKGTTPTPIKLVITKDKSGSGSYSTSHKNDRESRKRAHSPPAQDSVYKNFSETSSKHAKLDHSHSSHLSMKQSKVRHSSSRNVNQSSNDVGKRSHLGNDSTGYLNADVETYGGQPYYGNQYLSYQSTPPPLGLRGKTNSNPPLPPPLPPQPPPPPPE